MMRHAILSRKLLQAPARVNSRVSMMQFRAVALSSQQQTPPASSSSKQQEHLAAALLSGLLAPYWEMNPSAGAAIDAIQAWLPKSAITIDHIAFRTLGLPGMNIESINSAFFAPLGWKQSLDVLKFPKKKIEARWFSPPSTDLPRVFISQLKMHEISPKSQEILQTYMGSDAADMVGRVGPMTAILGMPPWQLPTVQDYRQVAEESEYAAWVLLHGFSLNHATVSVHRLEGLEGGIEALNAHLKDVGFTLNSEGGEVKISPDGLLLQSSTVADVVEYEFGDGELGRVPGCYIEFAERKVLPAFQHLDAGEIEEHHRRNGFEAASADKIFESTAVAAKNLEGGRNS